MDTPTPSLMTHCYNLDMNELYELYSIMYKSLGSNQQCRNSLVLLNNVEIYITKYQEKIVETEPGFEPRTSRSPVSIAQVVERRAIGPRSESRFRFKILVLKSGNVNNLI